MKPRPALLIALAAIAVMAVLTYRRPVAPVSDGRLDVAASFYPLGAFAKAVGGQHVIVTVAVPAGIEPHDFEPTSGDVAGMLSSELVLINGGGADAWAERLIPEIDPVRLVIFEEVAEFRGSQDGVDPHAWIDPSLATELVEAIRDRLSELDPAHAAEYAVNAEAETRRLAEADAAWRAGLSSCRKKIAVVSHDAYGYLAARYGFETRAVTGLAPDEEPSARKLAELAGLIRAEGLHHVFFETLVDKSYADVIARETGAAALTLNPLEGLTPSQEAAGMGYHEIMRENLANLRVALECL